MSTIEIKDIQEPENQLLTEDLGKISGGTMFPAPPYPENPPIPSMENIDELLAAAYAKFPDIFSDMPEYPGGDWGLPAGGAILPGSM